MLQANHFDEAAKLLYQLNRSAPRDVGILLNLGFIEGQKGNHTAAVQHLNKAVLIQPDLHQAWFNLGIALRDAGDMTAAVSALEQSVCKGGGKYGEALNSLAHAYSATGDLERAIATFKRALLVEPDRAEIHSGLGSAFQSVGMLSEAETCYRKAISLNPSIAIADNLGSVLFSQGRFEEAMDIYRQGVKRQPKNARLMSNLLLTLNYVPAIEQQTVFEEHRKFSDLFSSKKVFNNYPGTKDPERRLKIAYVSPDFREHSIAYFIEPVLKSHNRTSFEIYGYSNLSRPDDITHRLESLTEQWINVAGMGSDQFAERIREDEIDILVDLAGHTARNSLEVFSRQAAPIQVTWMGYPNTTGLQGMHYRIVDPVVDSSEQDIYYTEELVRLSGCFLCYKPPDDAPAISILPATKSEQVTFGSFNNLAKINENTIHLWSEVIKAVPGSRLLIKNPSLTDEKTRHRYQQKFLAQGLTEESVELIGHTPTRKEHLALYNRVDIGLDTFPYNGTTTTCEALWMGVPVLTLSGKHHASRVSHSLLQAAGLDGWVSETEKSFIENAAEKSADLDKLGALRTGLRKKLLASQLCNAEQFTGNLEQAYRRMWQNRPV